jgi:uncharacterized membrane protein YccC
MNMDTSHHAAPVGAQQGDLDRDIMGFPRLAVFVARCSGATTAAWKLSVLFGMSEPVWAAMSALIIAQIRLSDTRLCLQARILGTLLGMAISLSVNAIACRLHAPLVIQVALAVAISAAVAAQWPAFRVAMWTCPVILLATAPATPIVRAAMARGSEVILGALVGLGFHWGAEILIDAVVARVEARSKANSPTDPNRTL